MLLSVLFSSVFSFVEKESKKNASREFSYYSFARDDHTNVFKSKKFVASFGRFFFRAAPCVASALSFLFSLSLSSSLCLLIFLSLSHPPLRLSTTTIKKKTKKKKKKKKKKKNTREKVVSIDATACARERERKKGRGGARDLSEIVGRAPAA